MEEGEFENKSFMKARERHYIENFECVNKNVPNRTHKEWREANPEYQKEYCEENKEQIAEYQKEYYNKNIVEILEKKKQKYTCECGSTFRIDGLAEHKRTKKHLAYLSK